MRSLFADIARCQINVTQCRIEGEHLCERLRSSIAKLVHTKIYMRERVYEKRRTWHMGSSLTRPSRTDGTLEVVTVEVWLANYQSIIITETNYLPSRSRSLSLTRPSRTEGTLEVVTVEVSH